MASHRRPNPASVYNIHFLTPICCSRTLFNFPAVSLPYNKTAPDIHSCYPSKRRRRLATPHCFFRSFLPRLPFLLVVLATLRALVCPFTRPFADTLLHSCLKRKLPSASETLRPEGRKQRGSRQMRNEVERDSGFGRWNPKQVRERVNLKQVTTSSKRMPNGRLRPRPGGRC